MDARVLPRSTELRAAQSPEAVAIAEESLFSPLPVARPDRRSRPVAEGVLGAIGGTPLVRLHRLLPDAQFELYAKLEALNPGGSIKDRPALTILTRALATGRIRNGGPVIESSSGNMGIGIAQFCAYHGLRFICVIDPRTASHNVRLMRALGAEIDVVTEPDPESGEFLAARLRRVAALVNIHEGAFWPNQYANHDNAASHHQTLDEIVADLGGAPDGIFCATSTCGTLRGLRERSDDRALAVRFTAVDAEGSVLFGGQRGRRLIPGHGSGVVPALHDASLADAVVRVTDLDSVRGCRLLARREAIVAGGSSGAVVAAIERLAPTLPARSRQVLILADRGERYLDTVYEDAWVADRFGQSALNLDET